MTKRTILIFALLNLSYFVFSQKSDSIGYHFGGAVTVTTKGISTIPNLTLGKPAAIFDMSVGKRKLSFEPSFRFALNGKPWSFLFWWRYELLNTDKFLIKAGAHPAIAFRTVTYTTDGIPQEVIRAQRYLAGELSPSYLLTKNVSMGMYYLYSRGIEKDIIRNTNYLAVRINLYNIKLTNHYFLRFYPQLYYLNMGGDDGFYFNSTLTLARLNFPVIISSIINKTISTQIPVGEDFLWNLSLVYTFNKKYVEM